NAGTPEERQYIGLGLAEEWYRLDEQVEQVGRVVPGLVRDEGCAGSRRFAHLATSSQRHHHLSGSRCGPWSLTEVITTNAVERGVRGRRSVLALWLGGPWLGGPGQVVRRQPGSRQTPSKAL